MHCCSDKAHMTACAGDCLMMWLCMRLQITRSATALMPHRYFHRLHSYSYIEVTAYDHRSDAWHVMWQHLP